MTTLRRYAWLVVRFVAAMLFFVLLVFAVVDVFYAGRYREGTIELAVCAVALVVLLHAMHRVEIDKLEHEREKTQRVEADRAKHPRTPLPPG